MSLISGGTFVIKRASGFYLSGHYIRGCYKRSPLYMYTVGWKNVPPAKALVSFLALSLDGWMTRGKLSFFAPITTQPTLLKKFSLSFLYIRFLETKKNKRGKMFSNHCDWRSWAALELIKSGSNNRSKLLHLEIRATKSGAINRSYLKAVICSML